MQPYGGPEEHPYRHPDGGPRLRPSWVLYLDALGTKERAASLTEEQLRARLEPEAWYHRFLFHGNQRQHRRAVYFTDNVVVGVPAEEGAGQDPLIALNDLLQGAATYVVGMAIEAGVAVRGGVSFGPAYIDDVVLTDPLASVRAAHGKALVDAVLLEEQAGAPRVVVGQSVVAEAGRLVAERQRVVGLTPTDLWLQDDEGVVFLNHLASELVFDPSLGTRLPRIELLARYVRFIEAGLGNPDASIAGKYLWLAEYHDHVVRGLDFGASVYHGATRHCFRQV